MFLETERLFIRDFTDKDSADLFQILGDGETMKFCEPAYDFSKTKAFLFDFCIRKKGAVGAVLKENQKLIGYILFNEYEKGIFELGWFFNRDYWRRGFAYESCKALIEYAFSELCIQKIFAETIDREKSVKLMEKLGMKQKNIQKSFSKDNDGKLHDLYTYEITIKDFKK